MHRVRKLMFKLNIWLYRGGETWPASANICVTCAARFVIIIITQRSAAMNESLPQANHVNHGNHHVITSYMHISICAPHKIWIYRTPSQSARLAQFASERERHVPSHYRRPSRLDRRSRSLRPELTHSGRPRDLHASGRCAVRPSSKYPTLDASKAEATSADNASKVMPPVPTQYRGMHCVVFSYPQDTHEITNNYTNTRRLILRHQGSRVVIERIAFAQRQVKT